MKVTTYAPPFRPPFFRSLENLYSFDPYILAKMWKISTPIFHQNWAKCIVLTPLFYLCRVSSRRAVLSIPIRNLTPVGLAPYRFWYTAYSKRIYHMCFHFDTPWSLEIIILHSLKRQMSFWSNVRHWLHRKLSKWQISLQPLAKLRLSAQKLGEFILSDIWAHGYTHTAVSLWDPFYEHGLILIPAWISNYIDYKV